MAAQFNVGFPCSSGRDPRFDATVNTRPLDKLAAAKRYSFLYDEVLPQEKTKLRERLAVSAPKYHRSFLRILHACSPTATGQKSRHYISVVATRSSRSLACDHSQQSVLLVIFSGRTRPVSRRGMWGYSDVSNVMLLPSRLQQRVSYMQNFAQSRPEFVLSSVFYVRGRTGSYEHWCVNLCGQL